MQKDFILGVGCQKGATTWLRSQLNNHEKSNFGFAKEYHVFDRLYNLESIDHKVLKEYLYKKFIINNDFMSSYKKDHSSMKLKYLKLFGSFSKDNLKVIKNKLSRKYLLMKSNFIKPDKNNHLSYTRYHFDIDIRNYFDYFNSLFLSDKELSTTGDITPEYAGLPVEAFKYIKKNLEQKQFQVKIIFIMRDPLERIRSQARMIFAKNNYLEIESENKSLMQSIHFKNLEDEFVKYLYKNPSIVFRTRYENTINNLEKVFKKENIFYCLYENLFTEETLDRISSFLNLRNLSFDTNKIIWQTSKQDYELNLSNEVKNNISNFYRDTYSICDERFNASLFWESYKFI